MPIPVPDRWREAIEKARAHAASAVLSRQRLVQILSLIDLTSLNDSDTDDVVRALCAKACVDNSVSEHVAAVCVYPKFIATAVDTLIDLHLHGKVGVATVVNFPTGSEDQAAVAQMSEAALQAGASEVDIVYPYQQLLSSASASSSPSPSPSPASASETDAQSSSRTRSDAESHTLICQIADIVHRHRSPAASDRNGGKILKVILESGMFSSELLLLRAASVSVEAGADFLKTSTGKVAHGADLASVALLLELTKPSSPPASVSSSSAGRTIGVKVSGGVRTVADAEAYLFLAEQIWETTAIDASRLRFGASGLLDAVIAKLRGQEASSVPPVGY